MDIDTTNEAAAAPGAKPMRSRRLKALPLKFEEAVKAAAANSVTAAGLLPQSLLADVAVFSVDGVPVTARATDFESLGEIGSGRFGIVEKVRHRGTGCLFARKRIRQSFDQYDQEMQQREISVLRRTVECSFVVYFYGAMIYDGEVLIVMELMDASLRQLYLIAYKPEVNLPLTNPVLCYIAYSVLQALVYIRSIDVMHRDVKPSNMLVSRSGQVKICDFGVAGILKNSIAKTNVGCSMYVAPERVAVAIAGCAGDEPGYTTTADVWSLGISLLELAAGSHPYGAWKNPFHQVQHLTNGPPPTLSPEVAAGRFPAELNDFLSRCLAKNHTDRWRFSELLKHPYLAGVDSEQAELLNQTAQFVCKVLDRGGFKNEAAVE